MHPDRDFNLRHLPPNEADLAKDLELDVLLQAMAGGDQFLYAVARCGIHSCLPSPAEIVYRQRILADCIARPGVVRDLYQVAVRRPSPGRRSSSACCSSTIRRTASCVVRGRRWSCSSARCGG